MHGKKYDLSICLPGYRIENWERLYNSVYDSAKRYKWEMILVGPFPIEEIKDELPTIENFKYIFDKGAPCRCGQLATTFASGYYMTWGSDDGYFLENSLDEALDLAFSVDENDIIAMRYLEGPNHNSVEMPQEWYTARHHADQRLPGVLDHYKIAPVAMLRLEYFRWLGGWDARFQHINMSQHDLCFRAQKNGSNIHLSPKNVSSHHWDVNHESWQPMRDAYQLNDLPLFQQLYSEYNPDRICIDYNNWKNSPTEWRRKL